MIKASDRTGDTTVFTIWRGTGEDASSYHPAVLNHQITSAHCAISAETDSHSALNRYFHYPTSPWVDCVSADCSCSLKQFNGVNEFSKKIIFGRTAAFWLCLHCCVRRSIVKLHLQPNYGSQSHASAEAHSTASAFQRGQHHFPPTCSSNVAVRSESVSTHQILQIKES